MSYTVLPEVEMRPFGSPQQLEQRRFRALALLRRGYSPVEVARRVGVDRRSVRRWKAAVRQHGRRALAAQPVPGRPPRLDTEARRQLEADLLRGARACGFPTDLWTCPRVAEWIRRRFRVRYHVDHLCRLLRALGWSPQKPERRARERDERAIRRWVRRSWPEVKKTPSV
jgi:transposase